VREVGCVGTRPVRPRSRSQGACLQRCASDAPSCGSEPCGAGLAAGRREWRISTRGPLRRWSGLASESARHLLGRSGRRAREQAGVRACPTSNVGRCSPPVLRALGWRASEARAVTSTARHQAQGGCGQHEAELMSFLLSVLRVAASACVGPFRPRRDRVFHVKQDRRLLARRSAGVSLGSVTLVGRRYVLSLLSDRRRGVSRETERPNGITPARRLLPSTDRPGFALGGRAGTFEATRGSASQHGLQRTLPGAPPGHRTLPPPARPFHVKREGGSVSRETTTPEGGQGLSAPVRRVWTRRAARSLCLGNPASASF